MARWWPRAKHLVVESEGTKARLQATEKQLALFRYENQLFNLLLDQSGRFDLNELPEACIDSLGRSHPLQYSSRCKKHHAGWRC